MNCTRIAPTILIAALALPLTAQRTYTAHDYAQAERWMDYNIHGLVQHTIGNVKYLGDGRVFYSDPGSSGTEFMIADPVHGTKLPAFSNGKLAAALREASGQEFEASNLNVTDYTEDPEGGFTVTTYGESFRCDAGVSRCVAEPAPPAAHKRSKNQNEKPVGTKPESLEQTSDTELDHPSPDKKMVAFVRDNNLWVRVVATGEERPLTTDGVKDFGYATDNAGWQHSNAAILRWSADSKMIATFQQDQRKTGMMYLVPVTNRHPKLKAWRYPLLGDKNVTMIEPVIIDVATGKMVRLKTAPLEHRSMECDDVSCDGDSKWNDVVFSPDDTHLAFVSTARDHKDEWVRVADTSTGVVREVYHEHVPTYYGWQSKTDWKYLPESNEFLWVSERSNWAQLYLYDLTTGQLKNQVTHGDGPVADVAYVDQKTRVIYFTATDKESGENPYFVNLYRVNFDGTGQRLLTPEVATHAITAAPDGKTFVDVYSTVDTPQTAVVIDDNGKVMLTLAHQDISALLAAGWKLPTPITVKARDGRTDLYGILWKPTNFDAGKKYPVIEYVYPGPQDGSCSTLGYPEFETARDDSQAMADLGFVVVCIDGMGNPHRSKSFHDAHASTPAEMDDDTIPDQVAGIKELAARYAWVDATRVGIEGHSGGGNATVSAMFHFPDFFKVGWAESGNHDQREYEDDWDERWAGLETIGPDGQDNYAAQANADYAKDLKGHLMLVHGTMDDNVPPNNTLLVVDALMKANKDFDLIMVPNAHHGYGKETPYIMRRKWDYFVRYLAKGTPPENYTMTSYQEMIRKMYGPAAAAER